MDKLLFVIFILGSIFIFITIFLGIWSIITKREKKYYKMLEEFEMQKKSVEDVLRKRRGKI